MSRSRRRVKHGKCCCGRHLVPYVEFVHARQIGPGCPILEYVHDRNEMFLRFRSRRSEPSGHDV